MRLQSPRGVKNRDPQHWRDSQQMEHVLSKYIISDKSVTEEEWARERATVIDAEPAFGDGREENHLAAATELLAHQSFYSRAGYRSARPIPPSLTSGLQHTAGPYR